MVAGLLQLSRLGSHFPHFCRLCLPLVAYSPDFPTPTPEGHLPASLSETCSGAATPSMLEVWKNCCSPDKRTVSVAVFPAAPSSLVRTRSVSRRRTPGPSSASKSKHRPPALSSRTTQNRQFQSFFPQLPAWECANHRNVPNIDTSSPTISTYTLAAAGFNNMQINATITTIAEAYQSLKLM